MRQHWPTVATAMLVCLGAGAIWAATVTPSYRATATVTGSESIAQFASSEGALDDVRSAVSAQYGSEFSSTIATSARFDGSVVRLSADAEFAGVAEDLANMYALVVSDQNPSSTLVSAAAFPDSPRSPNLGRTALISGVVGALLGYSLAALRRRHTESSDTESSDTESSDTESSDTEASVQPAIEAGGHRGRDGEVARDRQPSAESVTRAPVKEPTPPRRAPTVAVPRVDPSRLSVGPRPRVEAPRVIAAAKPVRRYRTVPRVPSQAHE